MFSLVRIRYDIGPCPAQRAAPRSDIRYRVASPDLTLRTPTPNKAPLAWNLQRALGQLRVKRERPSDDVSENHADGGEMLMRRRARGYNYSCQSLRIRVTEV